ncbi:unnamed protein product [Heligmosomoides polygyrus]|uniref:HMG box domain-containing protein n=1 Tax=Heligmosomoides polygyrus TaxID=6339 RepID=A0A183GJZ2_HELPZ|nr:unnamed protein product [Heligmosomoides polygyrus]
MDDFSIYHIHNTDIDWHAIQPTFFNVTQNAAKTLDNEQEEKLELDESIEVGENTRPVSAYAMFFKERQVFAKLSCPHATFGDISRFVAAEWDALGKLERLVRCYDGSFSTP